MSFHKQNILLVGAGHAMLPVIEFSEEWRRKGHDVTLVSDHPWFYYSGMIPEYLGGGYKEDQVRIDIVKLAKKSGINFLQGLATGVDPHQKILKLNDDTSLPYDILVFDIGSINPRDSHSNPKSVITSKPLYNITTLTDFISRSADHPGELLIVGGGATGVEVALNVSVRLEEQIRSGNFTLHIYEQSERLLPDVPSSLSKYIYRILTNRGVRIHFQSTFEPLQQYADSSRVVLWATGTAANPIFSDAGLSVDDSGFMRVRYKLQSIDYPCIFGAGDCVAIEGMHPLRKIGVHAVKQGGLLAENLDKYIAALERGDKPDDTKLKSFRPYSITPLILSTGKPDGIWVAGPFWVRGKILLALKHYLDQKWIRRYNEQQIAGS